MDPATISLIIAVISEMPAITQAGQALITAMWGQKLTSEQVKALAEAERAARKRWAAVLEADRVAAGVGQGSLA